MLRKVESLISWLCSPMQPPGIKAYMLNMIDPTQKR
jgi:hypothetical protein